jgi:hypothetical protein
MDELTEADIDAMLDELGIEAVETNEIALQRIIELENLWDE